MSNRVALVTGGARRVGRAIVEKLAANGFDIAFTYLSSRQEAEGLASQIRAIGRQCIAVEADLTQPSTASARIAAQVEPLGRLDVLVNNASLYKPGGLQDPILPDSTRMWTIHVEGPLLLCQKFEKPLRESRGHVINMVDLLAERPWSNYLAYSASKGGLWTLTRGLARALAPDVTVNGIAPGVVEWPADYPQAEQEKYLKRVPLARAGTPQDVADLVHFLCTTGSYLTGQIIRLDGGRSIT
jgi:pteridine reductase